MSGTPWTGVTIAHPELSAMFRELPPIPSRTRNAEANDDPFLPCSQCCRYDTSLAKAVHNFESVNHRVIPVAPVKTHILNRARFSTGDESHLPST